MPASPPTPPRDTLAATLNGRAVRLDLVAFAGERRDRRRGRDGA